MGEQEVEEEEEEEEVVAIMDGDDAEAERADWLTEMLSVHFRRSLLRRSHSRSNPA